MLNYALKTVHYSQHILGKPIHGNQLQQELIEARTSNREAVGIIRKLIDYSLVFQDKQGRFVCTNDGEDAISELNG